MYVKFEKEKWALIRKAEKFDDEGEKTFSELSKEFTKRFLPTTQDGQKRNNLTNE